MNDTPRTNYIIEQVKGFRTASALYSLGQFSRTLERELTAVTEQREEARQLAQYYRNLSCETQDEADETLLPWETTNPNEL